MAERARKRKSSILSNNETYNDDKYLTPQESKELRILEKKLRIKRNGVLPKSFYDEGYGTIVQLCNKITSNNVSNDTFEFSSDSGENMDCAKGDSSRDIRNSLKKKKKTFKGKMKETNEKNFENQDQVNQYSSENYHSDDVTFLDANNGEDANLEKVKGKVSIKEMLELQKKSTKKQKRLLEGNSSEKLKKPDLYGRDLKKPVETSLSKKIDNLQISKERQTMLDYLEKRLKALLNRITEFNMAKILAEIKSIVQQNSVNDSTRILSTSIIKMCVSNIKTIENIMFPQIIVVAYLHQTLGIEYGSNFAEHVAKELNEVWNAWKNEDNDNKLVSNSNYVSEDDIVSDKRCHNCLSLLALLYYFKIINCSVLADCLDMFIDRFDIIDIELILHTIKFVGMEIRKHDPSVIKNFISKLNEKLDKDTKHRSNLRVKFMLETVMAIQNNNPKKISAFDYSIFIHFYNLFKSIITNESNNSNHKNGMGSIINVTLKDLLDVENRGRWWLVGSAWSGTSADLNEAPKNHQKHVTSESLDYIPTLLVKLAKQQRMNTALKRKIFFTLMQSNNADDACERLQKLSLKGNDCHEIIRVVFNCCLQEKIFNPFYLTVIQKLSEIHRSYKMSCMYSIWDKIRSLTTTKSSKTDKECKNDTTTEHHLNLIELICELLNSHHQNLNIFKVVEWNELKQQEIEFYCQLFIRLFQMPIANIKPLFVKISQSLECRGLKDSFSLFFHQFLLPFCDSKQIQSINAIRKAVNMYVSILNGLPI